MNDFHQEVLELIRKKRRIVWTTVIHSSGSTPQKAGSSAIFDKNGLLSGTVGGGIMEADTGTLAKGLLNNGLSNIYHFDLDSKPERDGAICGGNADILIDADPSRHTQALEALESSLHRRKEGMLITMIGKETKNRRKIERYWLEGKDPGKLAVNIRELIGETLQIHAPTIARTAPEVVKLPEHATSSFELAFIEYVTPLPQLVIAGAGHIGKALSHLGSLLDFEVTVVDDRSEFANSTDLPDADHVVVEDIGTFMEGFLPGPDAYFVIVTRGHLQDGEALRPLIGSDAAYVGMIGSRHKVATLKRQFLHKGWATTEEWEHIYAPVGLPIGSKSVQEIAISIAAQIISVRNDKSEKHGK
jgi:xanthine dehydrogenase accessory factor